MTHSRHSLFLAAAFAVPSVFAVTACNNLTPAAEGPALIAETTPGGRAELRAIVERALGRQDIRLAPDALTESPILALEQGVGAPAPARGRLVEMPERFELLLGRDGCYLVRTRTQERFRLEQSRCIPAPR